MESFKILLKSIDLFTGLLYNLFLVYFTFHCEWQTQIIYWGGEGEYWILNIITIRANLIEPIIANKYYGYENIVNLMCIYCIDDWLQSTDEMSSD